MEGDTMRALVVYESLFGNTREVAGAIADGPRGRLSVETVDVVEAPTALAVTWDLVVVGGPTHAFGLTRPSTRESAQQQGAPAGASLRRRGLREWLADVSGPKGLPVAVFDTRIARPRLPGSAARAAARRLRALEFRLQEPPESFWVEGTGGPLVEGELERARAWGALLVADVSGLASASSPA
ncbi:flavodoxin family protein [Egicoccus sp. AB-alg2]|uniref:flavodoxin family protein n=1 Tax=Egicoccus sp. AB-alg2 TaxID=3242693 RepID=UPI00359E96F4